MADQWTCGVCGVNVAWVMAVGGALETKDGRVLSVQLRGACRQHGEEVGRLLVDELRQSGATKTTTPETVRPKLIPAWRRDAEKELDALDSRVARGMRGNRP